MLAWTGGSRRKIKETKQSVQGRQRHFFEQRRLQNRSSASASSKAGAETAPSLPSKKRSGGSLDIISLTSLFIASKKSKPRVGELRDGVEDGVLDPSDVTLRLGKSQKARSSPANSKGTAGRLSERKEADDQQVASEQRTQGSGLHLKSDGQVVEGPETGPKPRGCARRSLDSKEEQPPRVKKVSSSKPQKRKGFDIFEAIEEDSSGPEKRAKQENYAAFAIQGTGEVAEGSPPSTPPTNTRQVSPQEGVNDLLRAFREEQGAKRSVDFHSKQPVSQNSQRASPYMFRAPEIFERSNGETEVFREPGLRSPQLPQRCFESTCFEDPLSSPNIRRSELQSTPEENVFDFRDLSSSHELDVPLRVSIPAAERDFFSINTTSGEYEPAVAPDQTLDLLSERFPAFEGSWMQQKPPVEPQEFCLGSPLSSPFLENRGTVDEISFFPTRGKARSFDLRSDSEPEAFPFFRDNEDRDPESSNETKFAKQTGSINGVLSPGLSNPEENPIDPFFETSDYQTGELQGLQIALGWRSGVAFSQSHAEEIPCDVRRSVKTFAFIDFTGEDSFDSREVLEAETSKGNREDDYPDLRESIEEEGQELLFDDDGLGLGPSPTRPLVGAGTQTVDETSPSFLRRQASDWLSPARTGKRRLQSPGYTTESKEHCFGASSPGLSVGIGHGDTGFPPPAPPPQRDYFELTKLELSVTTGTEPAAGGETEEIGREPETDCFEPLFPSFSSPVPRETSTPDGRRKELDFFRVELDDVSKEVEFEKRGPAKAVADRNPERDLLPESVFRDSAKRLFAQADFDLEDKAPSFESDGRPRDVRLASPKMRLDFLDARGGDEALCSEIPKADPRVLRESQHHELEAPVVSRVLSPAQDQDFLQAKQEVKPRCLERGDSCSAYPIEAPALSNAKLLSSPQAAVSLGKGKTGLVKGPSFSSAAFSPPAREEEVVFDQRLRSTDEILKRLVPKRVLEEGEDRPSKESRPTIKEALFCLDLNAAFTCETSFFENDAFRGRKEGAGFRGGQEASSAAGGRGVENGLGNSERFQPERKEPNLERTGESEAPCGGERRAENLFATSAGSTSQERNVGDANQLQRSPEVETEGFPEKLSLRSEAVRTGVAVDEKTELEGVQSRRFDERGAGLLAAEEIVNSGTEGKSERSVSNASAGVEEEPEIRRLSSVQQCFDGEPSQTEASSANLLVGSPGQEATQEMSEGQAKKWSDLDGGVRMDEGGPDRLTDGKGRMREWKKGMLKRGSERRSPQRQGVSR